jgi:multiple sugar transport system permease protein
MIGTQLLPTARGMWRRSVTRNATAYLFLLPALMMVMLVTVYAVAYAINFSLYRASITRRTDFVGLGNYERLATDPSIHDNLYRTLIYLGGAVPLTVAFGLILALVLNQQLRFRALIRTIVLLPWITSYLVSALLWKWMLNNDFGPIAAVLTEMGLPRINFLGPDLAMFALILTTVWNAYAFAMVIILAALQQVPQALVSAAEIDGASAWMRFRRVVFPLIKPSVMVSVIVTSLHFVNIVTLPLVLTGGGPGRMTEILPLRLFNEAFVFFNTGFASAMAVGVLVLNLALTGFYVIALRKKQQVY